MSEQKNTLHDSSIGWGILALVFICLSLLFWHFKGEEVKDSIRWLRVFQLWCVSWFIDDDRYMVPWGSTFLNFEKWYEFSYTTPKEGLNGDSMNQISTLAMYPLRFVWTGLLLLMGFWALFKGPKTQHRKKLDINMLIRHQAQVFPTISPFVTFNPSALPPRPPGAPVPADLPPFAEALGPEEWLAYNDVPVPDGKVDPEAAGRAFAAQLGDPWRGAMHLAPHRQVLLAAFCLKSVRKRAEADSLLGRLAASWSYERGLNIPSALLREARKILRNRDLAGNILSLCNQHAYENTALLRGLATAREEGGVLAPAQFVWLRAHDRVLWYPLNNLGRQAFHIEALGAICHYKAEKITSRPIPRPKIEDAVTAITDYMSSGKARPIPPLDYSRSKRRAIKKVKGT